MFCTCDTLSIGSSLYLEFTRAAFAGGDCRFDGADDCRRNGNADDAEDDDFKVLLYEGNSPEKETHQHEQRHPGNAANAVEERELRKVHVARTRDEGRKRAEERHEARDDDGEPAVLFKEVIELGHALRRERLDLARVDDARAEEAGDPIVRGVAQNGCSIENQQRCRQVQPATVGGEDTGCEQQGITWQEGEEHQARFDEHDDEQRRVHPHRAQRYDPTGNCATRVMEKTQDEVDDFHAILLLAKRL